MLHALTIILLCQLAGEILVAFTGLPFPGPVIGMILLLGIFLVRGSMNAQIERVGGALLSHLSLLFVPAGVGVVTHLAALQADALPLGMALVVPTLLTIAVTGFTMLWLERWRAGQAEPTATDMTGGSDEAD
ncbi:CidA/LrgA family protein [Notoacmeibacter sp. MSK16QG-6]|uniref:CidA/LrgA family protein n=1 Tax=Notoacmeibacter sp. MSK16QG-6 TaxID=2957982 RepID=UPI00209F2B85|nr:CidA/LrgA family protein [Notoacmeibacter sp. MSK16QG-6]MCP1199824.1 CidA/LrgA family protein [Notoacmeibacter sp. MSK16QG-6]